MSALDKLGIDRNKLVKIQKLSEAQSKTRESFSFKWGRRDTYESEAVNSEKKRWLIERYCGGNPNLLGQWLSGGRKTILDVGCGPGCTALLFFGEHLGKHDYLGLDISDAVNIARTRFHEAGYAGDFLKMNLFDAPIPDDSIDIIFSEGVLHHTDSTEKALKHLAKKLKRNGRFLFYVYAKKAVIREFTDDYIRNLLSDMTDAEAWDALRPLTQLGTALGKLNIEIDIPENVPLLGIKKGRVDLQRFFYWNVCKAYYRPEYTFDEMNHVNFDWYRPANCHRHTSEEIISWCQEALLDIEYMNVQDAGITVVTVKKHR